MSEHQHNEVGLTSTLNSVEVDIQGLGYFEALLVTLKPISPDVSDNLRVSALVPHQPSPEANNLSQAALSTKSRVADWILVEARSNSASEDAPFWQTILSQPLSTTRYDELCRDQQNVVTQVLPTTVARSPSDTSDVAPPTTSSPTCLGFHGLCHDTEFQVEVLLRTGNIQQPPIQASVRTQRAPLHLGQVACRGNMQFELTDKMFALIVDCVPCISFGTFVGPEHFERIGDGCVWRKP
eukprot:3133273-Pyramimonas_sp.AAC.2